MESSYSSGSRCMPQFAIASSMMRLQNRTASCTGSGYVWRMVPLGWRRAPRRSGVVGKAACLGAMRRG
jgi:site-specific recombinase XerD